MSSLSNISSEQKAQKRLKQSKDKSTADRFGAVSFRELYYELDNLDNGFKENTLFVNVPNRQFLYATKRVKLQKRIDELVAYITIHDKPRLEEYEEYIAERGKMKELLVSQKYAHECNDQFDYYNDSISTIPLPEGFPPAHRAQQSLLRVQKLYLRINPTAPVPSNTNYNRQNITDINSTVYKKPMTTFQITSEPKLRDIDAEVRRFVPIAASRSKSNAQPQQSSIMRSLATQIADNKSLIKSEAQLQSELLQPLPPPPPSDLPEQDELSKFLTEINKFDA